MNKDRRSPSEIDSAVNPPLGDDRLDSWKEIAAFLQRDVRTVQRWEKQAALPVYRHAESRLRTAYAYRSELERWWRTQRSAVEPEAAEPRVADAAPMPVDRDWFVPVVVAVLCAVVAGGVWAWRVAERVVPVAQPIGVVIAPFKPIPGDTNGVALLNGALERELASQPTVDVMPPAARRMILRLMRREADAPITVAVAREMCVRAGEARFVIAGRLRKLGAGYLVGLDVIEPSDGRIRATVEREIGAADQLHAAIHAQSREIGVRLGQLRPADAAPARLERVTTTSLDALQLYSDAVAADARRQWEASELLGRRAIAEDDGFASAYAQVAWAMRNQKRPADECLKFAERAVALAPATTEREMYFISGTYYSLAGDLAKATAAYEALISRHPQDRRALNRLIDVYSRSGRMKEAVEHSVRRAVAEPDDFYANVRAAHAMQIWHGDRTDAEPFLRRSRTLASAEKLRERPFWGAWLTLLPVFERWLADDPKSALATIGPVAGGLGSRLGRERDGFATAVGFSYLSMGRRLEAETAFRYASMPTRQIDLAMLALLNDDRKAARGWLLQVRDSSGDRPELFAQVGLVDDARRGLTRYFGAEHGDGIADVTRGLIAVDRGEQDRAVEVLRRGTELLRYSGEPAYFMGVESLAHIWLDRHDPMRAVRLLTDAARQRQRTYASPWWSGAFWIKANADLLTLDRRLGLDADAQRVNAMLYRALEYADADDPVRLMVANAAGVRPPTR
jgi:tetratricopeptide (TPR) repeat protein